MAATKGWSGDARATLSVAAGLGYKPSVSP